MRKSTRPSSHADPYLLAAGWTGTFLILLAYLLLSLGQIGAHSAAYQALNLIGSAGILAEALAKRDYPPAFLNVAWLAIALVALLRS